MSNKKKLLHLIPYQEFIPPKGGGALRCYNLCKELNKYFDVTLITLQEENSIEDKALDTVTVITPQKKIEYNGWYNKIKNALNYRCYLKTLKGPAEITVLGFYPVLKQLSKANSFDYVLMEHLSTIDLGKVIKKLFPKAIRIADQHNVDHLLYKQNHDITKPQYLKTYNRIRFQEEQLYKNADFVFACSELDVTILEKINDYKIKGYVVPNGTSLNANKIKRTKTNTFDLLFCGSLGYTPNKNGLLWFYKNIWPELKVGLKNIRLTIIGRNGQDKAYDLLKKDPQINFIGEVEEVNAYYLASHIAIVPLLEGSGTRLKILEAMSFGVPVISTSIGAEGIDYKENKNILIADDPKSFRNAIIEAFKNKGKLEEVGNNGLKLVTETYNWTKIVKTAATKLNAIT